MGLGKKTFIFLSLLILILGICSGALGEQFRFFVIGILYCLGVFLLKYNPYQKIYIGVLIYLTPFFLLMVPTEIYNLIYSNYRAIPFVISAFFGMFFAFKFCKYNNKTIGYSLLIATVFLAISTAFLPNYYNYMGHIKNNLESNELPNIIIYDESNKVVDIETFKGKITVLDVWLSSCGVCIKKFPEFERLKNEYKKDTTISFYTLNLPLKRDKRKEVSEITKPYNFTKLYASEQAKEKLKIELVPTYLIIDKNMKIRYVGSINTSSTEIYHNFFTIINNIKNEK